MKKPFYIIPFVLISLLIGIYTGWLRMGWQYPAVPGLGEHGAIMIGSFLGTVVILERVITMKRKIIFIIPFINALSILFFLIDRYKIGYLCLLAGSLGLTGIMFYYTLKFREYHNYLMLLGALCLVAGNLFLIMILRYPESTTWWISFFLLTITAERLELSRYLPVSERRKYILIILLLIFVIGIILPFHSYGKYISASAMFLTALWLLTNDLALKALKKEGVFRYTALLLISGYLWLFVTGVFFVINSQSNYTYDAGLHSFFLGFVFSMIFAHAPIILPGITQMNIKPYHRFLYFWFILLQLSILLRLAGDLTENPAVRQWGGLLNGIAILGFFADMIVYITVRKSKSKKNI